MTLTTNLDPSLLVPSASFDPLDESSYNFKSTQTILDSELRKHDLELYFIKRSVDTYTQPNTWTLAIQVDGVSVADPYDTWSPFAAGFDLVFNHDGMLNETLTSDVLVTNWAPLNSPGALGPINRSDHRYVYLLKPAISSNFRVDVGQTSQLASAEISTVVIRPNLGLNSAYGVPNSTFQVSDSASYNYFEVHDIYDTLGIRHELELYYIKSLVDRQWSVIAQVNGRDIGDSGVGSSPTQKLFNLVFTELGELDTAASSSGLVSNRVPMDAGGQLNGALTPLNVVNGGSLPIIVPPISSNFEIDFSGVTEY